MKTLNIPLVCIGILVWVSAGSSLVSLLVN